jgi:hypothetical protein
MPEKLIIEKIKDTAEAVAVNGTLLTISMNSVEQWLRMLSIAVAVSYTIWKWSKDIKKQKEE